MICKNNIGRELGMLSDVQILARLVAHDDFMIFVSPLIDPKNQLGPSSLDVRLGTELTITRNIDSTHIDLTKSKEEVRDQKRRYFDKWIVPPNGSFVLHPGAFALAPTLEWIRLPSDIAGRIEGRSTIGRLGLKVHATAGFVDPGYAGPLTFELTNSGNLPIKIRPGYRLGQLCFFKVHDVQVDYPLKSSHKYGGKSGSELAKPEDDPEIISHFKNEILVDFIPLEPKVLSYFDARGQLNYSGVSIEDNLRFEIGADSSALQNAIDFAVGQPVQFMITFPAGVSSSLIASFIYRKLFGRAKKLCINRREVEFDQDKIKRIIDTTFIED
jgi:dCTP deaminase